MDIIQRHIALKINYLEGLIRQMPDVSTFTRINKNSVSTKVRVHRNGTTLYTAGAKTQKGQALLLSGELKQKYLSELNSLHSYWHSRWREPVPKLVRKSTAGGPSVRSPLLSLENYLRAEPYCNLAYPIRNGILLNDKMYRSKGEIKVAGNLSSLGLEFKYETMLDAGGHGVFPDFFARSVEINNCAYVEYCGMLDDPNYYNQYIMKRQLYHNMGLREGVDVVFINEFRDINVSDDWIKLLILHALEFDAKFEEQPMQFRTRL